VKPTIFSILTTILVDVFIICHNVYSTSGFLRLIVRYPQEIKKLCYRQMQTLKETCGDNN
jgi:hypothetical protein